MIFLEKAYAKFNGNYAQLNGGLATNSLRDLTGMPVEHYDIRTQSDEDFFTIVQEANRKQYSMTVACIHNIHGLVDYHSYTLLGVV